MKKKVFSLLGTMLLSLTAYAAPHINKIDPPFWYTGMQNPELQLMVYGEGIGDARVAVDYPGVSVSSIVKLESNNYLLVYLNLDKDVKPGKMQLTFSQGKKQTVQEYELKARAMKGCEHKGFDASDALYLLMPDRFANGNPDNDQVEGMLDAKVDRNDPNARHGGDLAGIEQHLDYFTDLGVTALWFTPVLENNMQGGSYHGYATTDYYKVDPRFGTNEEYRQLISKAHQRGIKIVMDMIFNHCGVDHAWIKDMPSKDWFNNSDYQNNFVQTSFKLTSHVDPYTSQYDFNQMNDGWFVPTMPDLNQKNPHVLRYLIQNSFWWIEFANIDGIRMDTYPYADYDGMSQWMKELNEEYPNYNTVGETWVTEPAYTAWWQKDSKLSAPKNSNLKTVMDFSFFDKINIAKNEQTETWFKGLDRVYNNFVYDFLYPNPASVLAFIENHDTDRFLGEGQNLAMLKQATTLLLTTRRIPQLYYGTEIMMNGVKTKSDGYVRCDFPGGWANDKQNAFTAEGRTDLQNECYNFYKTILNWRKGNDVIAKGSMTQFMVQHGVYAYARQYEGKTVFVMLNGTDSETTLPLKFYKEILKDAKQGKDILTGRTISFSEDLKMAPRESLVIEL
ncbi:glycoside hydrolase family 13 protein [Mediterranea massiliensis]|uniref:Glycoside hydrolase family 13 protein n=1 Tax=Mediterranea massiliensis TaxID=1841865 RepID=A0ABS2E1G2_9BACT|nr:glycoside hydrolase family 13 protein [Mediterranea massiliensis]MBM6735458.1 glycoside hydrolase family 13 protein [Mediterranea massiliensis]